MKKMGCVRNKGREIKQELQTFSFDLVIWQKAELCKEMGFHTAPDDPQMDGKTVAPGTLRSKDPVMK